VKTVLAIIWGVAIKVFSSILVVVGRKKKETGGGLFFWKAFNFCWTLIWAADKDKLSG